MSHSEALEVTLAAAGRPMLSSHSALAELARTLASQMDEAGREPSTRLSAAYLSVLKDISRVIAVQPLKVESSKASTLARLRENNVTSKPNAA